MLDRTVERLSRLTPLDRVGDLLEGLADEVFARREWKDAASGTWLGHAAHPPLTDLTLGSLAAASLLDLFGPRMEPAARRLVGIGLLASLPTVVTGLADWTDTSGDTKRLGTAHALLNLVVFQLYAASWAARAVGGTRLGRRLGWAGAGVSVVSAYLGGHLLMRKGVGVDNTVFLDLPREWTTVADRDALEDGVPRRVGLGGAEILVVRIGEEVHALADRCAHRGGPLHQGAVVDGAVVCPWHGSTFSLRDGSIVTGPTTAPQPALETRTTAAGLVEVRAVG